MLITVASWEERFLASFRTSVHEETVSRVLMFYMQEYRKWSRANRQKVSQICSTNEIELIAEPLSMEDPVSNWKKLNETVVRLVGEGREVVVDISTAPREVIWILFWILEEVGAAVQYSYQQPASYNRDWLSRDPGVPRLVYKLSGVADPLRPTLFVAVVGFDVRRTARVIQYFEPEKALLGLQSGGPFEVNVAKMDAHKSRFAGLEGIELFSVDAYSDDHGESAVLERVESNLGSHNIIMTSLGPKPSAVALYRIQRRHGEVALAYAPARDFNRNYSQGVGNRIRGRLA